MLILNGFDSGIVPHTGKERGDSSFNGLVHVLECYKFSSILHRHSFCFGKLIKRTVRCVWLGLGHGNTEAAKVFDNGSMQSQKTVQQAKHIKIQIVQLQGLTQLSITPFQEILVDFTESRYF